VPEPSSFALAGLASCFALTCGARKRVRTRRAAKKLLPLSLAVAVLSFLGSVASAQPAIQNPSFETPALPLGSSAFQPAGSGWNYVSSPFHTIGIASNGSTNAGTFPALDGTQAAYLGGDESISQTVSGFTVGQNYQLDWLQDRISDNSGGSALRVVLD